MSEITEAINVQTVQTAPGYASAEPDIETVQKLSLIHI